MLLELCPLYGATDESLFAMTIDDDGVARRKDVNETASPLALWPTLFCCDDVLLLDHHSMVMPASWPFVLWKSLHGNRTSTLRMVVTRAALDEKHDEPHPRSARLLAYVHWMHPFQTPAYRPLLTWLLRPDATPLQLPDGTTATHISEYRIRYKDVNYSWIDWFALFACFEADMFELQVTVEATHFLLARDPQQQSFVMLHTIEASAMEATPIGVVASHWSSPVPKKKRPASGRLSPTTEGRKKAFSGRRGEVSTPTPTRNVPPGFLVCHWG